METFSTEFSQLLYRWTKLRNNEKENAHTLLTSEELVKAIQDGLQNNLNVNLLTFINDKWKTPTNEICPKIPDAPTLYKEDNKYKDTVNDNQSLITPMTTDFENDRDELSNPCPLTIPFEAKMDVVDTDANTLPTSDVKQPDRANKNNFGRSETFTAPSDRTFIEESGQIKLSHSELNTFMECLDEYRLNACNMIKSIDTIKDKIKPTRPIRRLSSMSFTGLLRTSLVRMTSRKSMIRGIPVTPTTSRVSPGSIKRPVSTTKSTSTVALQHKAKRSIPNRSMNAANLNERNKSLRKPAESYDLKICSESRKILATKPLNISIKSPAAVESSLLTSIAKSSGKINTKQSNLPFFPNAVSKVGLKRKITDKR